MPEIPSEMPAVMGSSDMLLLLVGLEFLGVGLTPGFVGILPRVTECLVVRPITTEFMDIPVIVGLECFVEKLAEFLETHRE